MHLKDVRHTLPLLGGYLAPLRAAYGTAVNGKPEINVFDAGGEFAACAAYDGPASEQDLKAASTLLLDLVHLYHGDKIVAKPRK